MELMHMILIMFIGSFIIQYFIMPPIMTNNISNFTNNIGKAYMAFFMAISMVFIELFMHDYPFKSPAFQLYGIIFILLALFIFLYRKQVGVDDKQYLEGMIEHHSMAILTSEEILKKTSNYDVAKLAQNIIELQQSEINQMREILKET